MKRELAIGITAVASVALIAGGFYLSKSNSGNRDQKSIDEMYFEMLLNSDKYVFCLGEESITGRYSNDILGNESGQIDYQSKDISVFDKEQNKLYILGREIEYKYNGKGGIVNQAGVGSIETNEQGQLTEYYDKNEAPVRIEYLSGIIFPAPDRRSKDWVTLTIKGMGTVLGYTEDRVDVSQGDAKTYCSFFPFSQKSFDADINFSGKCSEGITIPGVSFDGNFKYTCTIIDSKLGVEKLKEYRASEKEDLPVCDIRGGSASSNDCVNEPFLDQETIDALSLPEEEKPDIRQQLEEMREEIKGSMQAE